MNGISNKDWRIAGLAILCIRFVQGWIFWGGGSRRFIYAPEKLDPYATQWMANKLQSAMPGALLGVGNIVNYLLQHFLLLYVAIVLFSLVELLSGLALIFGFFTRAAGFITALISITLMLLFGWQGATCLDEWTMAVANLSIGLTLALSGASIYSIDSWLIKCYPNLDNNKWFVSLASGSWSINKLKKISIIYFAFTVLFTLVTYNYYRGAIFSRYHVGPVSASEHHITLSDGLVNTNGSISFKIYVDAGTAALPSNIIRIELLDIKNKELEIWEGKNLSIISSKDIINDYLYNRIMTGSYGLVAPVSAKAKVLLPPVIENLHLPKADYKLQIYTINGHRFSLDIKK